MYKAKFANAECTNRFFFARTELEKKHPKIKTSRLSVHQKAAAAAAADRLKHTLAADSDQHHRQSRFQELISEYQMLARHQRQIANSWLSCIKNQCETTTIVFFLKKYLYVTWYTTVSWKRAF